MLLETLYVRFFRSFNYDYLRKSDYRSEPKPWDYMKEMIYPFVEINLHNQITTIVGANESGKSQLLAAIKFLLTGVGILPRDFCRYSQFFTVGEQMTLPEFGGKFTELSVSEIEAVQLITGQKSIVKSFYLFRTNQGTVLFLSKEKDGKSYPVDKEKEKVLILPTYSEIDPNIPLPDSVPIDYLVEGGRSNNIRSRRRMFRAQKLFRDNIDKFVAVSNPQQPNQLSGVADLIREDAFEEDSSFLDQRLALAYTLLIQVAGIDKAAFKELQEAAKQDDGFANNIVKKMNERLAFALNFPKWWSQDNKFSLQLTLRDFDLVFTVKDRTDSDYAFSERSEGMKYFLSYFVQYLSYKNKSNSEILLMDEPDRFLSTSGQQDLLKLFAKFANPDDPQRLPVQVVYVTHSPFLIDKNHSDRIRVLEKGEGDEGTRVVKNAAKNHYEPLRSAFGAFVAETTFIGNCNLIMEGQADQVLIANISSLVHDFRPNSEALDLNNLTLVPAGSAGHIPYLVYLARGRDVEKPAIVVLLDGDKSGIAAKNELNKGFRGRLLAPEYILMTSDLDNRVTKETESVREIEDLIPARLAVEAVKRVAKEVLKSDDAASLIAKLQVFIPEKTETMFDAAARAASDASIGQDSPLRLDKVAFARAVFESVKFKDPGWDIVLDNFIVLFDEINLRQRQAMRKQSQDRMSTLINQLKVGFLRDHPNSVTKADLRDFLEKVESKISDMPDDTEQIRDAIRNITADLQLKQDPRSLIVDLDGLKQRLNSLAYIGLRDVQVSEAVEVIQPSTQTIQKKRPTKQKEIVP